MSITICHCLTNVLQHIVDGGRDLGAQRVTGSAPHLDHADASGHTDIGWPQVSLFAACVNSLCDVPRSPSHAMTHTHTQTHTEWCKVYWAKSIPQTSLSDLLQLCAVRQLGLTSSAPGARHSAFMTADLVDTRDVCGTVGWIWKPIDAEKKNRKFVRIAESILISILIVSNNFRYIIKNIVRDYSHISHSNYSFSA